MKKIFALVMVVTILGAFLAGCSKAEDAGAGGASSSGTSASGTS